MKKNSPEWYVARQDRRLKRRDMLQKRREKLVDKITKIELEIDELNYLISYE